MSDTSDTAMAAHRVRLRRALALSSRQVEALRVLYEDVHFRRQVAALLSERGDMNIALRCALEDKVMEREHFEQHLFAAEKEAATRCTCEALSLGRCPVHPDTGA